MTRRSFFARLCVLVVAPMVLRMPKSEAPLAPESKNHQNINVDSLKRRLELEYACAFRHFQQRSEGPRNIGAFLAEQERKARRA